MKRETKPTMHGSGRIRLLSGLFFVLFAALIVRLSVLQVSSSSYYRGVAEDQHAFFAQLAPARGDIKITDQLSPEPVPVATNVEAPLVYVVPKEITNKTVAVQSLARALQLLEADVESRLQNLEKVYVPLKRNITQTEQDAVKALALPGVYFDTEVTRFYPEHAFLSHVVGFLGYRDDSGSKKVGVYGLERKYEQILAGVPGAARSDSSLVRRWLFGNGTEFAPAKHGNQLLLTIDRSIQMQVERVLDKAVKDNLADSGCVVVMEPKTGAILAMASNPSYDPNEYNKVPDQAVFNSQCTSTYEPGSVFKAVTMAAGVDEGLVGPDTTYTDTGSVVVDGYTIKNSDNKAHGVQTMTQVLEESLNTGVIFVQNKLGNGRFLDYVKRFGFGEVTGVDLPEMAGNLSNLKGNITVNYDTASFGQGVTVTPLQMVRAYAALANGGKMPVPYVVAAQIASDGQTVQTQPKTEEVVSSKTAATVSAMLVNVVEHGHGKRAGVKGYYVAGKTGTAQVSKKDGGGYDPDNNIGTFVGYAPVEDPKFVMLVRVNHPRTVQYAESTAAPAWGELAQFILSYLNVPPTRGK
ncbi:MAG: penicillin-binding protein 2 [Candidatus Doudnabacteria bacterium]|nr:penicillin-binding protein 2 [Candidatus Doudnabacteria bacterium]